MEFASEIRIRARKIPPISQIKESESKNIKTFGSWDSTMMMTSQKTSGLEWRVSEAGVLNTECCNLHS